MDRDLHVSSGNHGASVARAAMIAAVMFVCLLAIGFAIGVFNSRPQNGMAQNTGVATQQSPAPDLFNQLMIFQDWERPAVAIVLTGEQHGYLQPCGCSQPQYGGLARRYNLIQEMRKRGWPVVAADLGDVNQIKAPKDLPNVQGTLKYTYAMRAMDQMGYAAVNVGEYEMRMPLPVVLGNFALNNPTPRVVAANLLNRQPGQVFAGTVFDWALADKTTGPKVGFLGLISQSVENKVKDPNVTFHPKTALVLGKALPELKAAGAELIVLLYQGTKAEAKECAKYISDQHQTNPKKFPMVDVIVCLSEEAQPPALPIQAGRPMIVQAGHKGLNAGVIGVFNVKSGAPFELKYQLVAIGPEFNTPRGQEQGHKIMELMEEYTAELKRDGYLAKYKPVNHSVQVAQPNAEYAGSFACQNCHAHAYKIWEGTPHSHAYDTLVSTAKHPSLRQFDGECIVCHTVGFGYKTGFQNFDKTKHLTDVGCESCHGPCSEHVARPNNKALYPDINRWKWREPNPPNQAQENRRQLLIDTFCQSCHDLDNDNNFQFNVKWPKVIHMNPGAAPGPAAANGGWQIDAKK